MEIFGNVFGFRSMTVDSTQEWIQDVSRTLCKRKQEVLDGVTAGGAPARKALRVSEHQEEEEEDDRSSLQ